MTIKIIHSGDLFTSEMRVLVNAVNCIGIMGAGLAKHFKVRYPVMFEDYIQACKNKELVPGKLHFWKENGNHDILNFPTKNHWREDSKIDWIDAGLKGFTLQYKDWGIESIAFPALGCGLGNLDWNVVKPLMESYLLPLDIDVEIYEPIGIK